MLLSESMWKYSQRCICYVLYEFHGIMQNDITSKKINQEQQIDE